MPQTSIPAAQYLRMSTDFQQYSLAYQSQTIAQYAERHGFSIVQTYSDPAISGVLLRMRKGLQGLIQDVTQGRATYKAILVYDVSRWGRFQDTDESAYYEFLCKSAGVRVHYCAESFSNDDSMPSMVMKALKRAMAGEFSREMGVKVLASKNRGANLGFWQGAPPGYGLRRLLLSDDRTPKQMLVRGELKSVATDRIILVPGPANEVRCVRKIYNMFTREHMTFAAIARELNRRQITRGEHLEWTTSVIRGILSNPKYVGWNIYGRCTRRLYAPLKKKPRSEWSVLPGAFEPLIDEKTYERAQHEIARRRSELPRSRSDEDLLEALRSVLAKNGRISVDLIKRTPNTPSQLTYRKRFGNLIHAYAMIGYKAVRDEGWLQKRQFAYQLRDDLMKKIVDADPIRVTFEDRGGVFRSRLRLQDGRFVSVIASRPCRCDGAGIRWVVKPTRDESNLITLIGRLDPQCSSFKDLFVAPPFGRPGAHYLKEDDPILQGAIRLTELKDFYDSIQKISGR